MIPVFLFTSMITPSSALALPAPVPIFTKHGFSSILEFTEAPTRAVIGDLGSFQLERLDKSILIRPTADDATTNLVVYFKSSGPRMFVIKSSLDDEPALYRKFEAAKPETPLPTKKIPFPEHSASRILGAKFDPKGDFMTVTVVVAAPLREAVAPDWKKIHLKYQKREIKPTTLWAERPEIQPGTSVKARFVFAKPRIPRSMSGVTLHLSDAKDKSIFSLKLGVGR